MTLLILAAAGLVGLALMSGSKKREAISKVPPSPPPQYGGPGLPQPPDTAPAPKPPGKNNPKTTLKASLSQQTSAMSPPDLSPISKKTPPATPPAPSPMSPDEMMVLEQINIWRKKYRRKPLVPDHALIVAANEQSNYQNKTKKMGHTGPDGQYATSRVYAAGYTGGKPIGENVAYSDAKPAQIVSWWMASKEHKRNILNSSFTRTGISRVGNYWTEVFGG